MVRLQQVWDDFRLRRIVQQLIDFAGRSISDGLKQWERLIELLSSECRIAGGV